MRTVWTDDSIQEPEWWPVLGPAHDDSSVIGFPMVHYHIDYRYLTPEQRAGADRRKTDDPGLHAVFLFPVITVMPDMEGTPPFMLMGVPMPGGTRMFPVADLPHPEIPEETYLRTLPKRRLWKYPAYPYNLVDWRGDIEEAYQGAKLGKNMICPHQGAILTGIAPDADGNVTCPLHGLCWNPETGRMVKKASQPS